MFSIFVPEFTKTAERTTAGRVVFAVSMREERAPASTVGQAMQYAKDHGYRAPIVGPSSRRQ